MTKIIGISGPSGSGKSTLAENMLKKLPNCKVINGDIVFLVMHKQQKLVNIDNASVEEQLQSLPNETVNENELEEVKLPQGNNEIRDFLHNIIKFGEYELAKQIQDAQKSKVDFIVVEWIFLPALKIYDLCDYKIQLFASPAACVNNQKKREAEGGRKYVKGFADNAEFIRKKLTEGIGSDYTLFLDTNIDKQTDELCRKILCGEDIKS
jgi:uridine kinase